MNRRKILIQLIPIWVLLLALQGPLWSQANCEDNSLCLASMSGNGPEPCDSKLYCNNNGSVQDGFLACTPAADNDGCGVDLSIATIPSIASPTRTLLNNLPSDCYQPNWSVQWLRFMTDNGVNQFSLQLIDKKVEAYAVYWREGWNGVGDASEAELCDDPVNNFTLIGTCVTVNQYTEFINDLTTATNNLYFVAIIYDGIGNANVKFKAKNCVEGDPDVCIPSITCPDPITVQCNDINAINDWLLTAGGNNCDADFSISNNDFLNTDFGDCGSVGDKTATFTLLNNNDIVVQVNNVDVSCMVTVTTTACQPIINCPDNLTIECDDIAARDAWLLDVSADNCGLSDIVSDDFDLTDFAGCTTLQDYEVIFRLDENADINCTSILTTEAVCVPTITCPADITIRCNDLAIRDNWLVDVIGDDCNGGITEVNNNFIPEDFEGCSNFRDYEVEFSLDADASINCTATLTTVNNSIGCLPPNVQYTLSADECEYLVTPLDVITQASTPIGVTIMLFYDEAMTRPVPTSPVLTAMEIDSTIYIKAITASGISCWTSTNAIEDKTAPILECPCDDPSAPCEFACTQVDSILTGLITGPLPTVFDACGGALDTMVVDELIGGTGCEADTIRRTVTVEDASGNEATCTYDLLILQPTEEDIDFPDNVELACDAGFAIDQNGAPSPDVTGYPTAFGVPIVNGSTCDVVAFYTDNIVDPFGCDGRAKCFRNWKVTNCCPDLDVELEFTQIISVIDTVGPSITGVPTDTVALETQSDNCSAIYILPNFSVTDNCDGGAIDVVVTSSAGTQNNAGTAIFGLPLGISEIYLSAKDDCDNITLDTFLVIVSDDDPPVMSCETFRIVGLSVGPASFVSAIAFDDGSNDNCGIDTFLVRRMDNPNCTGDDATTFADEVPFFCCDVGGANVMVELQAIDAAGNSNSCMVEVEVRDELNPEITCPVDKTINCDQDFTDLSLTGTATGTDNCGPLTFDSTDSGELNMCREGVITRTWTATDASGNSDQCVQVITVVNPDPFNPAEDVTFPPSIDIDCTESTDTSNTGVPVLNTNVCDMVVYTFVDETVILTSPSQVVTKILRTWRIFDWCVDNNNPVATDLQVIVQKDTIAPTFTCPDDISVNTGTDINIVIADLLDNCSAVADLNIVVLVNGVPVGDLSSLVGNTGLDTNFPEGTNQVEIIVTDPQTNISADCTFDVDVGTGLVIECSDFINTDSTFIVGIDGDGIGILNANQPDLYENGNIPANTLVSLTENGTYSSSLSFTCADLNNFSRDTIEVFLQFSDENGNQVNCSDSIIIRDTQNPSVTCVGSFDVVFTDSEPDFTFDPGVLITNTSDQCTPTNLLNFSTIPQSVNSSILPGQTSISVLVLVNDLDGNGGTCPVPVNLSMGSNVAGIIENEEGAEVEYVHVAATGGNISEEVMTSETGDYNFSLVNNDNYVITPERNDDPLNGVSTLDLIKINKHILQVETLNSPYKVIAADINRSGEVTTFDLVKLRKLILHIDTEFTDNTSWRFVDADFVFPDPVNPFATDFPEVYSINGLSGDMIADFVAVKVGDVNCSASANDLQGSGDDRSAATPILFQVEEQVLAAGESYTIDFNLKELEDLEGYQFTLHFDQSALTFDEVKAGELPGLTGNNFGMQLLDRGVLTASWHTHETMDVDEIVAFSLSFTANTNVALSEVLSISSAYTKAEAYRGAVIAPVDLAFETNQGLVTKQFQLFQNRPNPFKGETVISFQLPDAQAGSLKIYDLTGRIIKTVQGQYHAGYNEITLCQADLAGQGVYYYQLEVAEHSAMRKMILLE